MGFLSYNSLELRLVIHVNRSGSYQVKANMNFQNSNPNTTHDLSRRKLILGSNVLNLGDVRAVLQKKKPHRSELLDFARPSAKIAFSIEPSVNSVPTERPPSEMSLNLSSQSASSPNLNISSSAGMF